MTMLQPNPTGSGRSRYRSGDAQWPHVGDVIAGARCSAAARCSRLGAALRRSRADCIAASGTVGQRDGGRVSAAGDER
jgi:hypothetical protein